MFPKGHIKFEALTYLVRRCLPLLIAHNRVMDQLLIRSVRILLLNHMILSYTYSNTTSNKPLMSCCKWTLINEQYMKVDRRLFQIKPLHFQLLTAYYFTLRPLFGR